MMLLTLPGVDLQASLLTPVLRAGETVEGSVELNLDAATAVRGVRAEVFQRELTRASILYRPLVYRMPVPRLSGRTRSGVARTELLAAAQLLPGAATLPAGRQVWHLHLPLPASALATYSGLAVVVEHELLLTIDLADGRRAQRWVPLHLWTASPPLTPPHPVEAGTHRGDLQLRLAVRDDTLDLSQPLRFTWQVANPSEVRLGRLFFELWARETSRHIAATDVSEFRGVRHRLRLAQRPQQSGEVEMLLAPNLAPTLRGPRFRLDWRIEARLNLPWALGLTVSVPLTLVDRAAAEPSAPEAEKEEQSNE